MADTSSSWLSSFNQPAPDTGAAPVSYQDPTWDDAEASAAEETGVPQGFLQSIRVNGERSNGDQVSPAGARGVYQFMPATRDAVLRKYGVDAYSRDPKQQALATALLAKEIEGRTHDGYGARTAGGYNGGIAGERNPDNNPETAAYAQRVAGGLGLPGLDPQTQVGIQRGLQLISNLPGAKDTGPDLSWMDNVAARSRRDAAAAQVPEPPKKDSAMQFAGNTLADLGIGVNTTLGSLVDIVAPGSDVSKFFKGNEETLRGMQSEARQQLTQESNARVAKAYQDAGGGAAGIRAEGKQALQEVKDHPELVAAFMAQLAPSVALTIGTGGVAGAAGLGSLAVRGAMAGANAALGYGQARGEIYDRLKDEYTKQGLSPEEADAKASTTSALYAVPSGAIAGAAGSTGLESTIGSPLARGLSLHGAADTVTDLVQQATTSSFKRRLATGAATGAAELGGQVAQGVAPVLSANLAAAEVNPDTDVTQGLGQATAQSLIGGLPFAGVAGKRASGRAKRDAAAMDAALNDPEAPPEAKLAARLGIAQAAAKKGIPDDQIVAWLKDEAAKDDAYAEGQAQQAQDAGLASAGRAGAAAQKLDFMQNQEGVPLVPGARDLVTGLPEAAPGAAEDAGLGRAMQAAGPAAEANPISTGLAEPMDASRPEASAPIVPGVQAAISQRGDGAVPRIPGMRNLTEDIQGAPRGPFSEIPTPPPGDGPGGPGGPGDGGAPAAERPPTPMEAFTQQVQQTAVQAAAVDAQGKKLGVVKPAALRVYHEVVQAHDSGLIDAQQAAEMTGRLVGSATLMGDVRSDLNRVRVEAEVAKSTAEAEAADMAATKQRIADRTAREKAAREQKPQGEKTNGTETPETQPRVAQPEAPAGEAAEPPAPADPQAWLNDPDHPIAPVLAAVESKHGEMRGPGRLWMALANNFNADGTRRVDAQGEPIATAPSATEVAEAYKAATGEDAKPNTVQRYLVRHGIGAKLRKNAAIQADTGAVSAAEALQGGGRGVESGDEGGPRQVVQTVDPVEPQLSGDKAAEAARVNAEAAGEEPAGADETAARAELRRTLGGRLKDADTAEFLNKAWSVTAGNDMLFQDLSSAERARFIQALSENIAGERDSAAMQATAHDIVVKHRPPEAPAARESRSTAPADGRWRQGVDELSTMEAGDVPIVARESEKTLALAEDPPDVVLDANTTVAPLAPNRGLRAALAAAVHTLNETPLKTVLRWAHKGVKGAAWVRMPDGFKNVHGFFDGEHVFLNAALAKAAEAAQSSTKPIVDLARTLGHEFMHGADWLAGGKRGYISAHPDSPLHASVQAADGKLTFNLGPVAQELLAVYRGETHGNSEGGHAAQGPRGARTEAGGGAQVARGDSARLGVEADHRAVSGADEGRPQGNDVGQSVAGSSRGATQRRVRGQVQAEGASGRERIPGDDGRERGAGMEPASRENPSQADHGAGELQAQHEGTLAGLSLDQPLKALADFQERAELGWDFTPEQIAAAKQAAYDASTEGLTHIYEAWTTDPKALKHQAPMAFALMEALTRTHSPEHFASVMTGRVKVKGLEAAPARAAANDAHTAIRAARRSEGPAPARRLDQRILSAVKDAVANRGKKETAIPLAEARDVHGAVRMFGSTERAIAIDSTHVRHILDNHPEITPEDIAAIPDMLKNPRAILKDGDGLLVITARRDDAGNPVLVVLKKARMLPDGEVREGHPRYGDATRVTGVSSEFGWEASARNIVRGLRDGNVLYLSKEGVARAKELLSTASIAAQSPKGHDNLVPTPGNIRPGRASAKAEEAPANAQQKQNTTTVRFYSDPAVRMFEQRQPWAAMRSQMEVPAAVLNNVDAHVPRAARFSLGAIPEPVPARQERQAVRQMQDTFKSALSFHLHRFGEKVVTTAGLTPDVVRSAVRAGVKSADTYQQFKRRAEAERLNANRKVEAVVAEARSLRPDAYKAVNKFLAASRLADEWGFDPKHLAEADRANARYTPGSAIAQQFNRLPEPAKKVVRSLFEDEYRRAKAMEAAARDSVSTPADMRPLDLSKPYASLGRFGNHVVIAKSKAYRETEALLQDPEIDDDARSAARQQLSELRADGDHFVVAFRQGAYDAYRMEQALKATGKFESTESMERDSGAYRHQGGVLGTFQRLRTMLGDSVDELSGRERAALDKAMSDFELTLVANQSARHALQQAEKIAGFDEDMIRSYEAHGNAVNSFIASLQHSREVEAAIGQMRREVRNGTGSTADKQLFVNELVKRHMMDLDYKPTRITNKLMAASSVWNLLTSPSYYLVNATQPFALSQPYMAGQHGWARSGAELFKAWRETATALKGEFHTLEDLSRLPADVRSEVQELARSSALQVTISHELGRWGDGNKHVAGAMNKLRNLSETVEALNRVSTAMAAVRLAKAKGWSHDKVLAYAGEVLDNTHGDYSGYATPGLMRTRSGRLITQFRKFQIIQAGLFLKLTHDAFKGATPEERSIARKSLAFTLGHMAFLGGMTGLPLYGTANFILAALAGGGIIGDKNDPWDTEQKVRDLTGNGQLSLLLTQGVPAFMGLSLSKRIAAGEAFSPLPYTDLSLDREGAQNIVLGLAGPFFGGTLPSMMDGAGQIVKGEYWKGAELMLPRGIRDALQATRFETQGVTNRKGDLLQDASDVSLASGIFKALGLPTTSITERSRQTNLAYQTTQFFKDRAADITRDYIRAQARNDTDALADARQGWLDLQKAKAKAGFKVEPLSHLRNAVTAQQRRNRQVAGGVQFTRTSQQYVQRLTGTGE